MSYNANDSSAPPSPEKRRRMHLWSPRRLSSIKRTMSSPITTRAELEKKLPDTPFRPDSPLLAPEEETIQDGGEVQSDLSGGREQNGSRDGWLDDGASTGTAFREEVNKFDDTGKWANNLFYVYARRTDDSRFSRFLLTFSNARVCCEWWSLIQTHFGGAPSNTREGAQFFSFNSDDLPGRAWKHHAFERLRTKWMYSQIGDAVGTMGKGQEIIPLQDERGFPITGAPRPSSRNNNDADSTSERPSSIAGSITESNNNWRERSTTKPLRRSSKRDSGILLPSSPLLGFHERSNSLPVNSPFPAIAGTPPPTSSATPPAPFDFSRMEQNLGKIEKLMESNASQLRTLEHVQAANLERLTSALVQNAEMVKQLGDGQRILSQEMTRMAEERSLERLGSRSESVGSSGCGHEVKRGPRKLGRQVVGYVYADAEGRKTVEPARKSVMFDM